jgi:hypothetical protein
MLSGNFAEMTPFLRHLGIFYMPQIYDMAPTALLPLYMYTNIKLVSYQITTGGLHEKLVVATWSLGNRF